MQCCGVDLTLFPVASLMHIIELRATYELCENLILGVKDF